MGLKLPLPPYLHTADVAQNAQPAFLVLWQSDAGKSDWQPLETNTVLLMRAQSCWQNIRRVGLFVITCVLELSAGHFHLSSFYIRVGFLLLQVICTYLAGT